VCLTAAEKSGAHAFRLTFSPAKEKRLRAAAASGRDIRQMIAYAIAYQFRKRLNAVPAFGFVIEEAPGTNKLHIHGCYLLSQTASADEIREAFITAAGKITGQAGSTQFWHDVAFTLDRYFTYSRKAEQTVKRNLGLSDVTFLNERLKRIGRETYEAARARKAPETAPQKATEQPCSSEQANTIRHKERAPRPCLGFLAAAKKFAAGKSVNADLHTYPAGSAKTLEIFGLGQSPPEPTSGESQ